jgi:hypothetical protein
MGLALTLMVALWMVVSPALAFALALALLLVHRRCCWWRTLMEHSM